MTFPLMPFAAPLGDLSVLSLLAVATSTSNSLTAPSSIRRGDLLVFYDAPYYTLGTEANNSAPSGFTLVCGAGNNTWRNTLAMSVKIASDSDAGATITGLNGTAANAKLLYVLRGSNRVKTFAASNAASFITNTNPGKLDIVSTGVTKPSVLICGASVAQAQTMNWRNYYPSDGTTPAFTDVNNSVSRLLTGLTPISRNGTLYSQQITIADLGSGNCMAGAWLSLT